MERGKKGGKLEKKYGKIIERHTKKREKKHLCDLQDILRLKFHTNKHTNKHRRHPHTISRHEQRHAYPENANLLHSNALRISPTKLSPRRNVLGTCFSHGAVDQLLSVSCLTCGRLRDMASCKCAYPIRVLLSFSLTFLSTAVRAKKCTHSRKHAYIKMNKGRERNTA